MNSIDRWPTLVPVVLCGGAGARLWPVSRDLHPKPFIRMPDGESLLQKAFKRGAQLPGVQDVFVITNRELGFKVQEECAAVGVQGVSQRLVLEPSPRNTAAAIATAAQLAQAIHGPQTMLLVLAADHLIRDEAGFSAAVAQAVHLAQNGRLVTFGIEPTCPETGYGYIEADGHRVVRFVEKPDADTARAYVASGRHLWNAGIFCLQVDTLLAEMQTLCPEVLSTVQSCLYSTPHSSQDPKITLNAELFAAVPDISIDYALMEKSSRVDVVPCNIGWSDIGSWAALAELAPADAAGNRLEGQAIMHDAHGCYVQSPHRMVGVVGLDDLVVIDTPDAVLVADRKRSQDVKHIYAQLKSKGHEAHRAHLTMHRPWGTYTVLEEGADFKIKRIVVKPGEQLSLQMHHHRSEHWIVVSGTAKVVNGDQEIMVHRNESTYIPAGQKHRLLNPGLIDLVLIEVQSGQYLGEDDIVRFEDTYGRA